ncbi:MAG: PBP1A family penicillin-binding protein [Calditrichia bacterium]
MTDYRNSEDFQNRKAQDNMSNRHSGPLHYFSSHKLLTASIIIALLVIGYLAFLVSGLPSLTKLEDIDPALVTRIYSEDGKVIHELFKYNRVYVPIEKIPPHTIEALLSTEDRRFYDHWGMDIRRIPKVVLVNLTSFSFRQGFSTITMQLARNLYFGFEKTLNRKFREILTALQIERTYSKREILEMYLNVAYFGHGVYGIQAASKKYFNKDAADLTINESATLIPLLKSPAYYSPILHPERSLQRRNLVLHNMEVVGYISEATQDSLREQPLEINEFEQTSKVAPYFTEYIRQKLNAIGDSLDLNVYEDGLNVYTTLNFQVQACMDSAIQVHMPELQERVRKKMSRIRRWKGMTDSLFQEKTKVQIAFVALNQQNGHILALVGGRDFKVSKFNRAIQARRQPGSAFKPFLYTTAIDNGYTPVDRILNQPVVVQNPDGTRWDPENYDKTFGGLTTLREALKKSINLVAVRLIQEVNPTAVAETANRLGISTPLRPFPALALGTSEVTPLDLVSAYGVFANQGVRVEPFAITRIDDRFGNVIYEKEPRRREVLNRSTAYIMTDMLKSVINDGTGGRVRWKFGFMEPAAGKTGTTNDYTDAWFVGFTPSLTAGVWVGLDDPQVSLGPGETGSMAALPFWADFMKCVYEQIDMPEGNFPQPPDVIRLKVCEESGQLATPFCPNVVEEVFKVKYHPTTECELHNSPEQKSPKNRVLF